MKRFALLRLWSIRSGRRCVGIVGLLFTLLLISCADGMAQSDQVVARGLKVFFEAWTERELSGDELRKVTDEFIVYNSKKGKKRAEIHESSKLFLEFAKILREQKGSPRALLLRHHLLEANYFDSDMQNTTELRLLTEPDPVRVVDPGGKHLMTEREVVALAQLLSFSSSKEEPRSQEFSRRQIDRLTIELDRAFGNHPNATPIPSYYRETAALWAGILREWPNLSAEHKRQVRAYVAKCDVPLPMDDHKLYGKLLDLDNFWAQSRQLNDINMFRIYVEGSAQLLSETLNLMMRRSQD
jgi:hypothetical protein